MRIPVMAARRTPWVGGCGVSLWIRFAALLHGVVWSLTGGNGASCAVVSVPGATVGGGGVGGAMCALADPSGTGSMVVASSTRSKVSAPADRGGSLVVAGRGGGGGLAGMPTGGGGFAHGDIRGERCDCPGEARGMDGGVTRGPRTGCRGPAALEGCGIPEVGAGDARGGW